MTSRDFCYWLQGKFELTPEGELKELNKWQVDMIRKHLAMVFKHEIDPSMGDKEHQGKLSAIHHGEVDCNSSSTATPQNLIARC